MPGSIIIRSPAPPGGGWTHGRAESRESRSPRSSPECARPQAAMPLRWKAVKAFAADNKADLRAIEMDVVSQSLRRRLPST